MQLFGTQKSHFTRKVRLLLDHLQRPYEFIDIGDVSRLSQDIFQDNPAMSVPVLKDGQQTVYDSDHIAAYIVKQFNPTDDFNVLTTDIDLLNARSLLNAAMSAEVRLVLGQRTGLDIENSDFFNKSKAVICATLDWCEAHASRFETSELTYIHFHLLSFWDHVHHYGLVEGHWPKISQITHSLSLLARCRNPRLCLNRLFVIRPYGQTIILEYFTRRRTQGR